MNKFFYTVAIIALLGLVACGGNKKEAKQAKHSEHNSMVVYYACPMTEHSYSAAKEPGECPECGMAMVAVVKTTDSDQDFYGCPMAEHSHIRQDEPGNCPECGMTLRPLKFDM